MRASGTPPDPVAEGERLLARAAEFTTPRLTDWARREGLATIKEAPHLQRTFRAALEDVAADASPRPQVSPSLSHGLRAEWPKLGSFDISLRWPGADVFGELKCGASELTLSACGWDAAKCAFCLQHGVGAAMFLVAAAPASLWSATALGVELLFDGDWDMADIRARYAAGFRIWERDGYRPQYVYRRLRTSAVTRTEFRIANVPWVLGVARVEPVDAERMDWPPLLPDVAPEPSARD